jgi:hypothetical protein
MPAQTEESTIAAVLAAQTPDAVISAIDARIRTRYSDLGLRFEERPEMGLMPLPVSQAPDSESRLLLIELARLYAIFRRPVLQVALPPSALSRLPVFGRLLDRVREGAHRLPLFYVHNAAHTQANGTRTLANVLNLLIKRALRQRAEIIALRADLSRLRERRGAATKGGA